MRSHIEENSVGPAGPEVRAGAAAGRPGHASLLALQSSAGNRAVAAVVQRAWVARQAPEGIYYHHHVGGVPDADGVKYRHVSGAAYVDEKDAVWSERKDEGLYRRTELRATYEGAKGATRAVGQSARKFNFSMRLRKAPANAKLIASSQKVLDEIRRKYGLTGLKVPKGRMAKHKYSKRPGVISGRTFRYLPGDVRERKPVVTTAGKVKAGKAALAAKILKAAKLPLGTASASPKVYQVTFQAPAAKAGRSSTAGAFNGISAGAHAGAHSAKLPVHVQPASKRRWEWLHLVGDALGGPTIAGNLAAGTFDSNSRHNSVEQAVAVESQHATPATPLDYRVTAHLIAGTEIARQFVCEIRSPLLRGGTWYTFPPVDTLTTTKEDVVEDALRRHAEHSGATKA